jgi:hypothetical protein
MIFKKEMTELDSYSHELMKNPEELFTKIKESKDIQRF